MSSLNRAHIVKATLPQQMIEAQLELEDRALLIDSARIVALTEAWN